MTIDLNPHHLDTVRAILAEHVPDCEVMAFGSRPAWTAHERSDLDLALDCGGRAGGGAIARLREAFEESDLPIRVDVLDWHAIADSFRELIAPGCVVIQQAGPPAGWRKVALGNVATLTKGLSYQSVHLNSGGPGLIGLGQFVPGGGAKIEDGRTYAGEYRDKDIARPGDLLIAMTDITQQGAVLGSPLLVPQSAGEFCLYTLDAGRLHLDENVDPQFAYYALRSCEFRAFAAAHATGTTVRRVRPIDVLAYEFALPPLAEQHRIARVLGALDERIEANRRVSATLEEMARALFRHWFVDFGPVRAKAAGLPSGLPPGLDALFPASFEASASGDAPTGWSMGSLGEAVTVLSGSTPSTKEAAWWGGEHWFVTPKDMSALLDPVILDSTRRLTDAGATRVRSGILPPGTVLFSSGAPIGRLAITGAPAVAGQRVIAMVCDGAVGAPYALHWAEANLPAIKMLATGTTFPEISRTTLGEMPFLVPPAPVHAAWDSFAAPLYARIAMLARKSRVLAALRDTLLPRLVSGEVRVPDTAEAAEPKSSC